MSYRRGTLRRRHIAPGTVLRWRDSETHAARSPSTYTHVRADTPADRSTHTGEPGYTLTHRRGGDETESSQNRPAAERTTLRASIYKSMTGIFATTLTFGNHRGKLFDRPIARSALDRLAPIRTHKRPR